jgi:hypothetical protein
MIPERQLGPQEDDGFSPYRTTDDMGNTNEMGIYLSVPAIFLIIDACMYMYPSLTRFSKTF